MFYSWITNILFCGHFPFHINLKFILFFKNCELISKHNFNEKSRQFNVIMVENVSNNFQKMCELNGISFHLSCPYTSLQNGKVDWKIRSINNIIRTLLIHASLPPSLWHYALEMATYISNILPRKSINFQSPVYMLYNKNPSYSHLCIFGFLCFSLFPSSTIHKLQPRSTPCVFLGYPSNHCDYKCLYMTNNKIIICRHVLFDEATFPYAKLHTRHSTTYNFLDNELSPYIINHIMTQGQTNSPHQI